MWSDSHWAELCPELTVLDHSSGVGQPFKYAEDPDLAAASDELRERMTRDGYFKMDNLPWAVEVKQLAQAAERLIERGHPASFLLAYREPWILAHQVKELLWMSTGNAQIFDWYPSSRLTHL